MRKIYILINFLIAFSLNAQGQMESYYFIKDTKTGQRIEIKDSLKLLKDRFGNPKKIIYPNTTENGYDGYIYADYDVFSVKATPDTTPDSQKIVAIYIKKKGVETYRGLKVGDTLDEVRVLFKDKKYRLEEYQNMHFIFIDLPFYEGGHITEDSILCKYDDSGIITSITVGAIVWD